MFPLFNGRALELANPINLFLTFRFLRINIRAQARFQGAETGRFFGLPWIYGICASLAIVNFRADMDPVYDLELV